VRIAEQNLYARSRELVGERNPREHEFAAQLRSFDAGDGEGRKCRFGARLKPPLVQNRFNPT
jgi:hypothetical protein